MLTFEERVELRQAVSDARRASVPRGSSAARHQRKQSGLSHRESQVLSLSAKGFTEPEMARHLHLSEGTVHSHAKHVREKLAAKTMSHAVALASQQGLIEVAA